MKRRPSVFAPEQLGLMRLRRSWPLLLIIAMGMLAAVILICAVPLYNGIVTAVELQRQINEAQGQAEAILAVAKATAEGLSRVGGALNERGGMQAMQLRVAEEYVKQFGKLATEAKSTLVVPADLSDIASMITMATSVIKSQPAAGAHP